MILCLTVLQNIPVKIILHFQNKRDGMKSLGNSGYRTPITRNEFQKLILKEADPFQGRLQHRFVRTIWQG